MTRQEFSQNAIHGPPNNRPTPGRVGEHNKRRHNKRHPQHPPRHPITPNNTHPEPPRGSRSATIPRPTPGNLAAIPYSQAALPISSDLHNETPRTNHTRQITRHPTHEVSRESREISSMNDTPQGKGTSPTVIRRTLTLTRAALTSTRIEEARRGPTPKLGQRARSQHSERKRTTRDPSKRMTNPSK
jgi:hypothetical protein